jgi:hypothetical protein
VERGACESLEDQHVQSAGEQVGFFGHNEHI